jgi:sulfate/thiosulfate transport system permease protein
LNAPGVALETSTPRTTATRRNIVRGALLLLAFLYIGVLLIAPVIGIITRAVADGGDVVIDTFRQTGVRHAAWLTFVIAAVTVGVTTVFGVMVAWVLNRHKFFGRGLINALVDLPLAVSPVTVGLMAVLLFGRGGWFEPFFAARGIQILFALPSMILVTMFICVPFVIREVGPILAEVGTAEEEASRTLGASGVQTFFRATLPNIRWGLLYGAALATARSLGEIGAVLIVSGTLAGQTETLPLYIFGALEERQEAAGNAVALSLALASVLLLAGIEIAKRRHEKEKAR